jgi:carboxypeptidase C (cathepsin A)
MLISSVLNFQTIRFNTGNDLPYIFFLPSYAATAWYHKCLPADLQDDLPLLLEEVKDFAMGPYSATLNDYVRGELAFESDLSYEVLSDFWQNWQFNEHQNEFVDVAETVRKAISMNPAMQVFVANGYYDLATTFLATEYTFDHINLEPALRDNIVMAYYEAGHMMYVHQESLAQMKKDLDAFIKSAIL